MTGSISPSTFKLLALSTLAGIGPAKLRQLAKNSRFMGLSVEELGQEVPALAKAISQLGAWQQAEDLAAEQVEAARKHDARIISVLDSDYPSLLAETKDDPAILFVKGDLISSTRGSVAIIGTREPTHHGRIIAARITEFFVENNRSVVSGLAIGCDALAHKATLDSDGHTVAVLAHGLQTVAPKQHQRLADEILMKGGALVSEYRFGQGVIPQQFVKRDRTQAGLACGVVMIQSDLAGGSLHASRAAVSYGRWLAVPYPTKDDCGSNEPKIQANLVLCDGSEREKAELLRCQESALSRIRVLRGRGDYSQLISAPGNSASNEILTDEKPKVPTPPSTGPQLSLL